MLTLMPWTKTRNNGAVPAANTHPLEVFRRFDEIFDRYFNGFPTYAPQHANSWGAELRETEKEVIVSLDAPGFEANEFDIQASDDSVTVTAQRVIKDGDEARTERSLERQISLPSIVDPNTVDAKYRNGVLELRLSKAEPARWKKVDVKGE